MTLIFEKTCKTTFNYRIKNGQFLALFEIGFKKTKNKFGLSEDFW